MDSDPTWRCKAAATLRIVSQKDGVDHKERQYDHILSSEENDWGWSQFSTLEVTFRLIYTCSLKNNLTTR